MTTEEVTIVLAEDDEGHAALIQRNLRRAGIANEIIHLRDGQEALDFIRRRGEYAHRVPDAPLLLLDIRMPRVDGVEVLRLLKGDPATAPVPVIMLTTTDDPREIQHCYELGCSVYVIKPVPYEQLTEALRRLGMFLSIVRVPQETHPG